MSKLLDDLIRQSRADAASYEEFLRTAEALARRLAAQQAHDGVPAILHGNREATVIFNNLPRILAEAAAAHGVADERPDYGEDAPPWRLKSIGPFASMRLRVGEVTRHAKRRC